MIFESILLKFSRWVHAVPLKNVSVIFNLLKRNLSMIFFLSQNDACWLPFIDPYMYCTSRFRLIPRNCIISMFTLHNFVHNQGSY